MILMSMPASVPASSRNPMGGVSLRTAMRMWGVFARMRAFSGCSLKVASRLYCRLAPALLSVCLSCMGPAALLEDSAAPHSWRGSVMARKAPKHSTRNIVNSAAGACPQKKKKKRAQGAALKNMLRRRRNVLRQDTHMLLWSHVLRWRRHDFVINTSIGRKITNG